jgi:hypothetical protein
LFSDRDGFLVDTIRNCALLCLFDAPFDSGLRLQPLSAPKDNYRYGQNRNKGEERHGHSHLLWFNYGHWLSYPRLGVSQCSLLMRSAPLEWGELSEFLGRGVTGIGQY